MSQSPIVVSDKATNRDLEFLEDQINEFNMATTGFYDGVRLVILLRDENGRIYAGLSGHTWGGACEVRFLWIEESRRRCGLGSRILDAAEAEARLRGCSKIMLSTHSFQAPEFYRKRGYVVTGEFRDYPRGRYGRDLFATVALRNRKQDERQRGTYHSGSDVGEQRLI